MHRSTPLHLSIQDRNTDRSGVGDRAALEKALQRFSPPPLGEAIVGPTVILQRDSTRHSLPTPSAYPTVVPAPVPLTPHCTPITMTLVPLMPVLPTEALECRQAILSTRRFHFVRWRALAPEPGWWPPQSLAEGTTIG